MLTLTNSPTAVVWRLLQRLFVGYFRRQQLLLLFVMAFKQQPKA